MWLSAAKDTASAPLSFSKLKMRGEASAARSTDTTRCTPGAVTNASVPLTTTEEIPLSAVSSCTAPSTRSPSRGAFASTTTSAFDPAHATARRFWPFAAAYAATLAQPLRSKSVSEAMTRGALSSETSTAVTPSSTTYATESCASTARAPVPISGRTDVTVKSARTSCGARHTSANSARREARAA